MNTTGQHVLNYLLAAAAIVAGLNPALLGPHGVMIVGGAVLAGNVLHGLATSGSVPPTQAAKALFMAIVVGVVFTIVVGLSACTTLPTPTQDAAITTTVSIATGFAIQQKDTDPKVWQTRAQQIKLIALELKQVNDAGTATLATLAADLQPQVQKLGPADVIAVNSLVAVLTPLLNQQLQNNPRVGNTQVAVDSILTAVITTCSAYGA